MSKQFCGDIVNNNLVDNEHSLQNLDRQQLLLQIAQMQEFLELQQLYTAAIREVCTKLENLDDEFKVRFDYNPINHIESRLKTLPSIMEKLERLNVSFSVTAARETLTDIAGVRVICNYLDDIYRLARLLSKQSDIKLERVKDYIKEHKSNGYRALHLIIKVPVFLSDRTEYVPVEVQLRTIAMDFWASLEHQLRYKSTADVSYELNARLKMCAEKSAALDQEMQAIFNELKQQNNKTPEDRLEDTSPL